MGAYEEQFVEKELTVQPMAMNSIQSNSYDSYTNSDGIIHSYVNNYFGKHISQDGFITDDAIVQIIPKDLCFILGEHFYVGKEYGFFIKVMIDETVREDYEVDIFVFDIQNIIPSFPSNVTGSTKVVPLFQYKYRAMDRNRRDNWVDFDTSLMRIVIKHTAYDAVEYYMSDVFFRHTLFNPTLLNPGDDGYNPKEDDGAFIIQMRYNSIGVGIKSKGGSFLLDTIEFGFGFSSGKSPADTVFSYVKNTLSYVDNLFHGFGSDKEYFYTRDAVFKDNEANIDTYETNNTDQIEVRHNLIKSTTTTPKGDSTWPQLINVGGGYAESKYVVARRSGSDYNKIHVVTSISANIVEDDTSRWWLFGWHEDGKIIEYGRTTGTYQVSNYQRTDDVILSEDTNTYVTSGQEHKITKFVPSISGNYRFETISSHGDPNFLVTDATIKETKYATDDLDGANNRNARLDTYLTAGHIYYIDAFSYDSSYGYSLHISYLPESSLTLTRDSNNSCFVDKGTYEMYKFVPTTTGFYDIVMLRETGDPYLFLFDSDGKKLKEDDDGLGNLNSLITYYLLANNTYYIAVQGYKGINAINGTIKVSPSIVQCSEILLNESLNIMVGSKTYVFEFTAPSTDSFDFYTFENSGDPYLELYDANRNQIAYDDDGNEGNNSLIRYNLVAGQKYYLHVRSYNSTDASYRFGVRLSE